MKKSKWEINDSLLSFKGLGVLVLHSGTSEIILRRVFFRGGKILLRCSYICNVAVEDYDVYISVPRTLLLLLSPFAFEKETRWIPWPINVL